MSSETITTVSFVGAPPFAAPTVVGSRHRERDWWLRRLLALADLVSWTLAIVFVAIVSSRLNFSPVNLWLLAAAPAWTMLCWLYGLYDRDTRRVSHTTVDDIPALFHAMLVAAVGLWCLSRALPVPALTFGDLFAFAAATVIAALVGRSSVRAISSLHWPPERVLMVGGGDTAAALVERMRSHGHYGLDPVGALTRRAGESSARLAVPSIGALGNADLAAIVAEHRIDRVMVADDLNDFRLLELVHKCQRLGVKLDLVPAVFGALGPAVAVDDVGGLTILAVSPPVLSRSDRLAKRAMDIVGSAVLLLFALPLLAVLALAVKSTSPGPVLFRQQRVGRGGRFFELLKFRSMCVDAEAQRAELLALSKDPDWLHLDHDPRITWIGRFLRQTSLDELPQLWNVLRGDMSLVGPRPLIVEEDSNVDGYARGRLDLTPGITGLWQVLGRTTIPFDEMVKLDYLYVTNWSLWADVRLLLRTLPSVLGQRGAN